MTSPSTFVRSMLLLALASAGLTACGDRSAESATDSGDVPTDAASAGDPSPEAAASGSGPATAGFDVDAVDESTAALGDFPYVALPAGYTGLGGSTLEFARAPLWTGDRIEWIEGRVYQDGFHADAGKQFSALEVARNLDHLVKQAGGVKVTESEIPAAIRDTIPAALAQELNDGLGDIWNYPVHTWLIRREDRNIWIHLCAHSAAGGLLVAESTPFEATAQLVPASELKSDLDASGRVAVEINFDTDSADILDESQPQLDQILALLREDPSLDLSIEGHTDGSGDPDHNQSLSERRAAAVVTELTGRGIEPSRLDSAGYGALRPVAPNDTEDGKRRNRRVELVKV